MKTPDFFIVGAPKCGTTSLATWLGEHPNVFMSPVKEPNYFCQDPRVRRHFTTPDSYNALFEQASSEQLCGEASTCYLFSNAAVPAILDANPRAKIIVMVRNPIDMVASYHAQKIYSLQEEETDLTAAWQLSPVRASGVSVAMHGHAPRYLDYRSIGRLGEQVRRVRALVPRDQLHIIVFDDLRENREAVYRDTLLFLELRPEAELASLPAMNARKKRVLPQLSRFLKRPPAPIAWAKRAALAAFPQQARAAGKRLQALTTRPIERSRVTGPLRHEMIETFRDDVALLGNLIDRDLRHWMGE